MTGPEQRELDALVSKLLDEQLSDAERDKLNRWLGEFAWARERYVELLDNHAALCAIYPGEVFESALVSDEGSAEDLISLSQHVDAGEAKPAIEKRIPGWLLGLAAAIMLSTGLLGFLLGYAGGGRGKIQSASEASVEEEPTLAGHATLRQALGVVWSSNSASYREGEVLPAGRLEFDAGVAEIDLFCGATIVIEGPAALELESDWIVHLFEGSLRANVPPAARGFSVRAADSEIVDLGTEFALQVSPESARLEVLDGEVKLVGGQGDGDHLFTGQGRWLGGSHAEQATPVLGSLSSAAELTRRSESARRSRFEQWLEANSVWKQDPRLIAYYLMNEKQNGRSITNVAPSGVEHNGTVIGGVTRVPGRFGMANHGLEFDRPGARVRVRLDGEYRAFTFACWVKIDSLKHRYNALFMGDGYENGEPHWQIRDDGRVMLSVMVDDSEDVEHFNEIDQRMVKGAGLHHVYLTPPIWEMGQSGQWFHLAAVFDPARRVVVQYVNGRQVSSEPILDKYYVDQLRIGPAEIGNWGQPFRETPWFAVRNLDGAIDEMAIFNAALKSNEIFEMYDMGKPLGY